MKLLKERFKTVLLIILVLTLLIATVLGISWFNTNKRVKLPNFVNVSKSDVLTWCGQLSPKFSCEIVYEDSDSVDVDKVISQSVQAGTKITDKVVFKISTGLAKEITPPVINSSTTRQDIENWITDNKIENVTFIDQESDSVAKGNVIKVEPTSGISGKTPINVYISTGKKADDDQNESKETTDGIYVAAGSYVGYSVSEFETKANQLGLSANHNTSRDAYSSNIEKGKVVWHGSGNYEKNETFNYGISLGENTTGLYINIPASEYVNTTPTDFEQTMKSKKLNPYHDSDMDDYSSSIEKGKVVWHGSGDYEENEKIRYGLSLGERATGSYINIPYNAYVDLTVEQFEAKMKELKLVPTHDSSMDKYSDSIDKGKIVWHGNSDDYVAGESIRYGLSLGKSSQPSGSTINISYNEYVNTTVTDFEQTMKSKKLNPYHDSEMDDYSTSIEKGKVVWHGSGDYEENEKIRYGLSLGKNQEEQPSTPTAYLGSFVDINNVCFATGDFNKASDNVKSLLSNAGFTNYSVVGASSRDVGVGVLISITVNGNAHSSRSAYPTDANIVVTICNASEAS